MQKRSDNIPAPVADEPVFDLGPSPLEEVWAKHKTAILVGGGAIIVAIIGFFGAMTVSHANRLAAMDALARATTPAEYQEVITKFPRSVEAGNASLLLSAALRNEKKPDEARAALESFLSSQPKHPLAPLALVGLAGLSAQGNDMATANADFQRVLTEYPSSFAAPFAILSEAEIALASGNRDAALTAFQSLSRQHPSTVAANAGQNTLMALESLVGGAPESAPPVTPESIELPPEAPADAPAMQVIDVDSDPGI